MAINGTFSAFRRELSSAFALYLDQEKLAERLNFCIINTDNTTLDSAARTIIELKKTNPEFCFTFSLDLDELKAELESQHYLTIYRKVVSISGEQAPISTSSKYIDQLSRSLMQEPVECTGGHFLEKRRAVLWEKQNRNVCPCRGNPHNLFSSHLKSIEGFEVDSELQGEIEQYREELKQAKAEKEETHQTLARQEVTIQSQGKMLKKQAAEIAQMKQPLNQPILDLVGGVFKIVTKSALLRYLPAAIKAFKLIPCVSAVIGVSLCAYRISQIYKRHKDQSKGFLAYVWENEKLEMLKAGAELVSGGIAFIPVFGTLAAVGMDFLLALGVDCLIVGADAYQIWQAKKAHNDTISKREQEEKEALEVLGVEQGASKQEIGSKGRKLALALSSDKDPDYPYLQKQDNIMMQVLTNNRTILEQPLEEI